MHEISKSTPEVSSEPGEIYCLQPHDFDELWPTVEPLLKKFQEEVGTAHVDDIHEMALMGMCQVWVWVVEGKVVGTVVTKVMQNRRDRYCFIWIAYGKDPSDGSHLDQFFGSIENWAREIDCKRIEIIGRRGWLRRLHGFRETGVQMEKNIERMH
jgi:hypothetical protein